MPQCTYKYMFISVLVVIIILVVFGAIVIILSKSNGVTAKTEKLIIDQDGGADDAMAIFMALLYEKYFDGPEVVAITTVHGNVNEPQVFNNTQRILDVAQRRDVPIFRGTKSALVRGFESNYFFGYDGLGDNATVEFEPIAAQPEPATLALIELSKKYEGNLSIVALGALTNIALAIKLDSEFLNRLSCLYVAAGNIYSEKYRQVEFNAQMDVEAYHIVARNGIPEKLTLIPFSQIMEYVNINDEWRVNVLGAIPTKIMRVQNVFEQVSIKASKSWDLLDPAAMAVALIPSLFVKETKYSDNSIQLCGEDRGIVINLFTSEQNATANVVKVVEEDPYKNFLFDIFSAPLVTSN